MANSCKEDFLSIPIDKLMQWRGGSWVKYSGNGNEIHVTVHFDQLLIRSNDKVLESINLTEKAKGFFKRGVLILVVNSPSQGIRKIKFNIKNNAKLYLDKLGKYLPVWSHNLNDPSTLRFVKIEEVMKRALSEQDHKNTSTMPTDFTNFVKLCLLDPKFPQIVMDTEKVLDSLK
ncbi:uncharacterized protein LOC105386375 isoform X1 [Plutella xylostella]|uniref:uncharacterized protein LOC105386375 isoform X1 n=1 Tax=Plutella xylostella TaxID=51655 RepID=UPI00203316C8|nr:uncharacterized protein LOC105386375 isoform X1 [Plutella xylostella]